METVSVVLATYNGEKYLHAQLQSLLYQTREPDEVVICDDCSDDSTVVLIRNFIEAHKLQNWTLMENDVNLGYIGNFRKAMAAATGDIVFLCDQDDIWLKDKVQNMAKIMEQCPYIEALVSGYCLIDSAGHSMFQRVKKFYAPPMHAKLVHPVKCGPVLHANMAQGCTGAYRRRLIQQYCQYDCCKTIAHDWALHMMAYDCAGLYFFNREMVCYRIHESNTIGLSGVSREDILNRDLESLLDAQQLPLSRKGKLALKQVADFYQLRLQAIQSRDCFAWLKGWGHFSKWILHDFFWQYMKDLYVMARWRIGPLR